MLADDQELTVISITSSRCQTKKEAEESDGAPRKMKRTPNQHKFLFNPNYHHPTTATSLFHNVHIHLRQANISELLKWY